MSQDVLTPDSQTLLLLCSTLGLPQGDKPLSTSEWNGIAASLTARSLRPGDLLGRGPLELCSDFGLEPRVAERAVRLLDRGGQLAFELERLTAKGIWAITRADGRYPRRWKSKLAKMAPVVVFGAGDWRGDNHRAMAIVGSRDVDADGLAFTRKLGWACAEARIRVISGGARGTDAEAVDACLAAGGQGVAILADSLEKALRKRELLTHIRSGALTLLTVVHPSTSFSVAAAMGRNKLIYCLSNWATVVASAAGSGGTWAGATENLARGWTPMFVRAVEGDGSGNAALLAQGAHPITSADIASADRLSAALGMTKTPGEAVAAAVVSEDAPSYEAESVDVESEAVTVQGSLTATPPVDAYELVAGTLLSYCATPRTVKDIESALHIVPAQAKAWLARAVQEQRLRKLARPVRYEAVASPLFREQP